MLRLAVLAMIFSVAGALAACDSKPKDSNAVDLTRGGTKAMDRAKGVAKTLEQGAARAREADDAGAAGDLMKKGY
jgi:hypothetical protein